MCGTCQVRFWTWRYVPLLHRSLLKATYCTDFQVVIPFRVYSEKI